MTAALEVATGGHESVKGKRGGSKPGGGSHNRQTTPSGSYTSFSKQKKAAAKSHTTSVDEIKSLPSGSVIYTADGTKWTKQFSSQGYETLNPTTPDGKFKGFCFIDEDEEIEDFIKANKGEVKIAIPESANPNQTKISKKKAEELAQPHKITTDDLKDLPDGTVVKASSKSSKGTDEYTIKNEDGSVKLVYSGSSKYSDTLDLSNPGDVEDFNDVYDGSESTIKVPDSAVAGKKSSTASSYTIDKTITEEQYEARKSKAFNATTAKEFDDEYRQQSGDIYSQLDSDDKQSLQSYTAGSYGRINGALRQGNAGSDYTNDDIDSITSAIDQSELHEDTILHRGINSSSAEKLFGLPSGTLSSGSNADQLVGQTGTDDAFMSCGSSNGTGFEKKVQIEILAPAGTKALYVEPFSACGDGAGLNWDQKQRADGKSKQKTFSYEDETILQRGTSLTVVSATYSGGHYHVKAAVTGQDYTTSEYSKKRSK